MQTLYIGADHGGFKLKQEIIPWLGEIMPDWTIYDQGASELDPDDDYPQYAFAVAEQVAQNEGHMGILICRSGNGMAIAANKVKGVRAALCFSPEHASKAREHNHANILVLDADYLTADQNKEIVEAFFNTAPGDGRHVRRVGEIERYELDK